MVAELLEYLAENESFASVKGFYSIKPNDVRSVLDELANQIRDLSVDEPIMRRSQVKEKDLASKTSQAISKLSPKEEEVLFRSFKIS